MRICYFGIYNPNYSRNRILKKGLLSNGFEVIECQSREGFLKKYWSLFKKHWLIRDKYDLMLVGFPGQGVMPLAWLLSKISGKKLIFDAFVSLYDANVFDRKICRPGSFQAGYYYFLDWLSCRSADKILLDTQAQIDYFVKTFKIDKGKFIRVFVGSDILDFEPEKNLIKPDKFLVHFHGYYIPLQGVEYIIQAAKLLENQNIQFNLIGRGQEYQKIINLAQLIGIKNINFIDEVSYDKLAGYILMADVCLGIFGITLKARRVIPNKVFEAMALAMPIITAETPAARELLKDRENCLFCQIGRADDLARKIIELKENKSLRDSIARNAEKLFKEKLTPHFLVRGLKEEII